MRSLVICWLRDSIRAMKYTEYTQRQHETIVFISFVVAIIINYICPGLTEGSHGHWVQSEEASQSHRRLSQVDPTTIRPTSDVILTQKRKSLRCCFCPQRPVECGHSADGQQQVEQRLSRVGQRVVLLQQVVQRGHLLAGQHVHDDDVPHRVASQEPMREQTDRPASRRQMTVFMCLIYRPNGGS